MQTYIPKKPISFLQRAANAAAKEQARLDKWNDPMRVAVRRVQTALRFEYEAAEEAAKQFAQDHAPVLCPYTRAELHPQRAEAIAKLAAKAGWSTDPREPVAPFKSLADMIEEFSATATAEFKAAQAHLVEVEAERNAS